MRVLLLSAMLLSCTLARPDIGLELRKYNYEKPQNQLNYQQQSQVSVSDTRFQGAQVEIQPQQMQEVQDNRFGEPVESTPGFTGQQETQPQNFGSSMEQTNSFSSNAGSTGSISQESFTGSQGPSNSGSQSSTSTSSETQYIDNSNGYNIQAPAQQANLFGSQSSGSQGSGFGLQSTGSGSLGSSQENFGNQNRFSGSQETVGQVSQSQENFGGSQVSQDRFGSSQVSQGSFAGSQGSFGGAQPQNNFGGSQSTFTSSQVSQTNFGSSQESFNGPAQSEVFQGQSQSINLGGSSGENRKVVRPVIQVGEPIIKKSFYIHAAPEDDEPAQVEQKIQTVRPEKHYKIIFIKAPNVAPAFSPSQAAALPKNEEKTIVYVLVNKPEAPEEVAEIPQPAPHVPSKPEVYFIKYKTKGEADNIVSGIQSGSYSGASSQGSSSDFGSQGSTSGFGSQGSSGSFESTGGYQDTNTGSGYASSEGSTGNFGSDSGNFGAVGDFQAGDASSSGSFGSASQSIDTDSFIQNVDIRKDETSNRNDLSDKYLPANSK